MRTASDIAPAALRSVERAPSRAECERCGRAFQRQTCERICSSCCEPLRRLRQRAKLTQHELAGRVGCRRNAIADLERDRFHPHLKLAERIAGELGVDVREAFPRLQITKGEAARLLGETGRDVKRLCDEKQLPANCEKSWHRLEYAAVRRLAEEREELRREWISFHAAEREYPLPWWLLRKLEAAGKFGDDVRIGDGRTARLGTRLVRRSRLESVHQELVENHEHVECPYCGKRPELGRQAHAECRGPLGSKQYWVHADPQTRQDRRRKHSEVVRAALAARPRERIIAWFQHWYESCFGKKPPARKIADWYYNRFHSTKMYGQLNKQLAAAKGKRLGPKINDEKDADIRQRLAAGEKHRSIARELNVSRSRIRRVERAVWAANGGD
jgi:transcriptional regulator with XRE-family HTH domain